MGVSDDAHNRLTENRFCSIIIQEYENMFAATGLQ